MALSMGTVSARDGEPGIGPGSMGVESFIVSGRGCEVALQTSFPRIATRPQS